MSMRKSKEIRREEVLDAALDEFAETGLHGASTEDIARRAGISQPYVFRLFTTKKELFTAVAARCFRETLELFQRAAEGKRGREALDAIGHRLCRTLVGTIRGGCKCKCRRTQHAAIPKSARLSETASATSSRTSSAWVGSRMRRRRGSSRSAC
jgi:AcrR family transcriptional regulator